MHSVRFRDPAGSVRHGEWTDDGLEFGGEIYDPVAVDVLAPSEPSKIVCVGLNFADHAEEEGMDVPDRPMLFLKPPNAVASHGDVVTIPGDKQIDYEAELAVVIGRQCRNVSEANAMEVVAGYTCMDDLSNRDDQRIEQNWVRGKAFDNAAPLGPVLASPEEVPDDASIELRVNGEVRQQSDRTELIFTIPELIAEISTYMTLEAGDVIATGTTSGVGPLANGDEVEVEIEGVGTLAHSVRVAK